MINALSALLFGRTDLISACYRALPCAEKGGFCCKCNCQKILVLKILLWTTFSSGILTSVISTVQTVWILLVSLPLAQEVIRHLLPKTSHTPPSTLQLPSWQLCPALPQEANHANQCILKEVHFELEELWSRIFLPYLCDSSLSCPSASLLLFQNPVLLFSFLLFSFSLTHVMRIVCICCC